MTFLKSRKNQSLRVAHRRQSSGRPARSSGSRNLIILGIFAAILTLFTTGIELWIYRTSGDIYLDRSRPGFLPDKEEATADTAASSTYSLSETGPLDSSELDEYLDELNSIRSSIQELENPYSPAPLSDESLGISTE